MSKYRVFYKVERFPYYLVKYETEASDEEEAIANVAKAGEESGTPLDDFLLNEGTIIKEVICDCIHDPVEVEDVEELQEGEEKNE